MSAPLIVIAGSGRMAPGIATACRAAGARVRIAGRDRSRAEAAARPAGAEAAMLGPPAFEGAAVVIETVVEDLDVKRSLLERVERWVPRDAIIATNTSSLSIESIGEPLERPDRFGGLHFLHPADLTDIVEVVPGPDTAAGTIEALAGLAARMGKRPLVLQRDVPGFVWNRLQFAMLRECLHLLESGVAGVEAIDAAVTDGLAPRWLAAGPLATADLGGSLTFRTAAEQLFSALADNRTDSARLARPFYNWSEDSRRSVESLRSDALSFARELAGRRRSTMPSAGT